MVLANLETKQKYQLLGSMKKLMQSTAPTLTETDILCLEAFYRHVLQGRDYEPQLIHEIPLDEIGEMLNTHDRLNYFGQALSVLPFINAEIDQQRIQGILDFAKLNSLDKDYIKLLDLIFNNQLQKALEHMTVKNYESIYGKVVSYQEAVHAFKPYKNGNTDLKLVEKYKDLESYPKDSLGYQFWHLYTRNKYQFPGEEDAYAESFAARHDATHLLASYNTSAQGEILVSTFTALMHDKYPMSGHIIPVIFSWHLQIDPLGGVNRANYGKLDIDKFWLAWHRGETMQIDFFDDQWDFWSHASENLHDLQKAYHLLDNVQVD